MIKSGSTELLLIPLVRLNAEVHATAALGDAIKLSSETNGLDVLLRGRRLGSVPPHYEEVVRSRGIFHGRISWLSSHPLEASISPG
jgi:hypothetical protein